MMTTSSASSQIVVAGAESIAAASEKQDNEKNDEDGHDVFLRNCVRRPKIWLGPNGFFALYYKEKNRRISYGVFTPSW